MNRYYFLLLMFIITSEVYSTSSSADRCQSAMSKMAQTKNQEEQIRIALDTLSAENFSFDAQDMVLKAIAHITSETKAPVIQKILEQPDPHDIRGISSSARYMSPDGSHTQSVMSKMAETKNQEEQIRIALEILENNPWPDVQIAILFSMSKEKIKDNTNRIPFKILELLEQNPLIPVLKSVIFSASHSGSSGVPFLITLLEHPLIKKHELIHLIAHTAHNFEGSAGFQVLSAILEKKLPLSFGTIEEMVVVATFIGGKDGADFLIKMLEEHSSNKMVQEQIAGHVRYMDDKSEAIRVLLALAEKNPPLEIENVMNESADRIGGEDEIHFLSTMLEKYPSSPLYETYKERRDYALEFLQKRRNLGFTL